MFYAHFVLNKKGPLARIWLAAHWDKKLTRAHVFETNINSSVEAILEPKVKLALRTSGHLLLGVVRIYSRKAKYLLADCNEAFVKIKMAFRPGMVVDLPEEANREAAIAAITLPENIQDFEATIADLNELDVITTANQSRPEDITLREDLGEINLGRQDDDFGEEAASVYDEPVSSREIMRGGDSNAADDIASLDGRGLSIRGRSDRRTDASSLLLSPGGKSTGPIDHSRDSNRNNNSDGRNDRALSVRGEPMDTNDDDDLGGGFLDNPDDDDDDDFGGEIDHDLFAASDIFSDPSARRQLEHITSEIESQIGAHSGTDQPGSTPAHVHDSPVHLPGDLGADNTTASIDTSSHMHSRTGLGPHSTDQTTLLTNDAEAFALHPIDTTSVHGTEVKRGPKRKRRLIIDEQKSIPSEVMKVQMNDTSDITAQLDLAPPTKKLMHWKETGGVDQLLAMPGRAIYSRTLLRLFTRNLKSVSVTMQEMQEEVGTASHHQTTSSLFSPQRQHGQQTPLRRDADDFLIPDLPAPQGHLYHQPGEDMSTIAESNENIQDSSGNRLDDIDLGNQLRNDPFLISEDHQRPHHDDTTAAGVDLLTDQPGDASYIAEPCTPLHMPPPSVLQSDFDALQGEDDDEGNPQQAEGEEEEAFQERRLEKRSRVMLKMLNSVLPGVVSDTDISFQSILKGNTKKQAAARFYTLLLLRKQNAVNLSQEKPFADIMVTRGATFDSYWYSA